jgi:nitrogen regulatory protein PII
VFKMIMAILPKGKIKKIMPVIKQVGIFGATMLSGKGMCTKEAEKMLGKKLCSSRELMIIITLSMNKDKIIKAIVKHADLKKPGNGIVFTMDITEIIG